MRCKWMRYMKTTQERGYIAQQEAETRVEGLHCPFRGKRKNLPNAWDDYWRRPVKNWKAYRKNHWRNGQPNFKWLNSETENELTEHHRQK